METLKILELGTLDPIGNCLILSGCVVRHGRVYMPPRNHTAMMFTSEASGWMMLRGAGSGCLGTGPELRGTLLGGCEESNHEPRRSLHACPKHTASFQSQRVHLDCQYEIRSQKPCMVWLLGLIPFIGSLNGPSGSASILQPQFVCIHTLLQQATSDSRASR